MPPHASVRTFLLSLVLACLVPGLIGAGMLILHEYRSSRAGFEKNAIQTARALAHTVDSHLYKAQAVAQSLSTSDTLRRKDYAGLYRQARDFLVLNPLGNSVALSDSTGQQIINLSREFGKPLPKHGSPEQIRRVVESGQPVISDVFQGAVAQQLLVTVDVPVIQDGRVTYVLTAVLRPIIFNNLLKTQGLPSNWIAGILDSKGIFIARTHAHEQFVGKKPSASLSRQINESMEGTVQAVTPDGIRVLNIYSRSAATGWTVVLSIPLDVLEAEYKKPLQMLVLFMLVVFVLGLGLAWWVGDKIASSIRSMTVPAKALGAGAAVQVPKAHIREAHEVASALIEASALLESRTNALRQSNTELLAKEAQFRSVFEQAAVGIALVGLDGKWVQVNDRLCEIVGYPREKLLSLSFQDITHAEDLAADLHLVGQLVDGRIPSYSMEKRYVRQDGFPVWANLFVSLVRTSDGTPNYFVSVLEDIQRRKEVETALATERATREQQLERLVVERTKALELAMQEMEDLAHTDALTGLQNRLSANERLRVEFLRMKRTGRAYSALLLDIDHFKQVNDTFGHEAGDNVLKQLAATLQASVRVTDFVARFGGEEFLVLLPETGTDGALVIANKIRVAVAAQQFLKVGRLTISVGVSYSLLTDASEDEAVGRADKALYEAKGHGRNKVCLT